MKRAPFKMLPSRSAVMKVNGRFHTSGRASFVWETLLMRRASGVPGDYEIRRGEIGSPWHRIELTIEEAEVLLIDWGTWRRVKRARAFRRNREQSGLPVE
jgi:hypothetical protein